MTVYASYRGKKDADGRPLGFLPGVPARSLTREEYDALDADGKKAVRKSDLYEIVEEPKAEKPAEKAEAPKGAEKGK